VSDVSLIIVSTLKTDSFVIGADIITPVSSVQDLGIHLDSDLSMRTYISKTVSACFAVLRQIRSIRQSVTRPVLQSLVASLVLTRLDFVVRLPARQLNRLQSVLNAAARLVYSARRSEHVSPLLYKLHRLSVPERIDSHLAVFVHCCFNGTAPRYLASEFERVADTASHRRLHSALSPRCMFHGCCTRPLATVHSLLPPRKSGTSCRRQSHHCRYCTHSSIH